MFWKSKIGKNNGFFWTTRQKLVRKQWRNDIYICSPSFELQIYISFLHCLRTNFCLIDKKSENEIFRWKFHLPEKIWKKKIWGLGREMDIRINGRPSTIINTNPQSPILLIFFLFKLQKINLSTIKFYRLYLIWIEFQL